MSLAIPKTQEVVASLCEAWGDICEARMLSETEVTCAAAFMLKMQIKGMGLTKLEELLDEIIAAFAIASEEHSNRKPV